jgi:hypothetical protein
MLYRRDIRVLVPGAGLGRLSWEIANLGFTCEGNEFSLFMVGGCFVVVNVAVSTDFCAQLFTSNYIINQYVDIQLISLRPT